jgi:hypothetical protein
MGKGHGKGGGDSCFKGECGGCYRCPGLRCDEYNGACAKCGGGEKGGRYAYCTGDVCKCRGGWEEREEKECECPECKPEDYEGLPTEFEEDRGGGGLSVSYRPRVCDGCEFCIGAYCDRDEMCCECPKCKPEKYGWEVVALANRDNCQKLAERWDKLNWRGYEMDDFERKCSRAVGEYTSSDDENEDEDEESDEERITPTYLRRECGPWSCVHNEWGRRWCDKGRPGQKFVKTIRECLDLEDLWGHLDEPWVYAQLSEAVVSKSSREYQGIDGKVVEELENDSSSEDSESNWKDLDVNDGEDEISFQRRVDLRRVTDRHARRERHTTRVRKEREEHERKERQEREERERNERKERERKERERKEREELDRKAAIKRNVYSNANVPPSKRIESKTLKEDSRQSIEEEVQKMRTAEIKEELSKRGISYEGRGELVAKLVQAIEEEVQKMRTAEITGELSKRGISYEGRGELVAKLVHAREIQAASRGGDDAGAPARLTCGSDWPTRDPTVPVGELETTGNEPPVVSW